LLLKILVTLYIESIKVNYNGKDYQTKKITVNVSKGQKTYSSITNQLNSSIIPTVNYLPKYLVPKTNHILEKIY
jgi:hypothetical protein